MRADRSEEGRCEPARERRQGEGGKTEQERRSGADAVAESPGAQQEHGVGERVDVQNPLQTGHLHVEGTLKRINSDIHN